MNLFSSQESGEIQNFVAFFLAENRAGNRELPVVTTFVAFPAPKGHQ